MRARLFRNALVSLYLAAVLLCVGGLLGGLKCRAPASQRVGAMPVVVTAVVSAWEGEIRLPAGAPGSFQSKHMRHTIQIQAGIDAPGNDPDSGWRDVQI